MATVAVFVALGGTSYAVATGSIDSREIKNNTVRGKDIRNNNVSTRDLKNGKAVSGADVVDDSLGGADIDESTLTGVGGAKGDTGPQGQAGPQGPAGSAGGPPSGPAGGDLTGSYPDPSIAGDAVNAAKVTDDSLTGADIAGNTLGGDDIAESTLGQVPSALLGGFGRSGGTTTCDPEAAAFFAFCAGTGFLSVPPGARALVFGRAGTAIKGTSSGGVGNCRLSTSSTGTVPNTQMLIESDDELGDRDNTTLVGVTPPLPAGATEFGIDCNEVSGDIFFSEVSVTALLISGS